MNNEQTPAPLSFDSPAIKDALQHYNLLKPLLRASLSNAQVFGLDLAAALTHEHEARVKAEKLLHTACLESVDDDEQITALCKPFTGEIPGDSYYTPTAYDYVEAVTKKLAAALSGLPAQAGEAHSSVLLAHRILAVLVGNGYIERGIYEECQLIMGAFIVGLLTDEPSAGALGEREAGK